MNVTSSVRSRVSDPRPLKLPNRMWSPDERRFLEAAFKAAEAMKGWWLERQAIFLEGVAGDDD
jgi:hypothetical protein